VLAAEHLLGLASVDGGGQIVEPAREVVGDWLPRFGPLDQHSEIFGTAAKRFAEIAIFFQAPPPLEQLLCAGLVLPEVGIGDAFFY